MTEADDQAHAVDPLIGRVVLGRYRIVRELARGGMGAIYLARSEGAASFVKPVVVKRMLPELVGDDAAARMFKREARIMGQLRHRGIVSVFDFGREEQSYLLVMDYVHGFHLGRWASWVIQQRGRVPVVLAVQIVIQILEALHHAHTLTGDNGEALRVVHRDVSPSNVLLDVEGHVRLADFGIAQSGGDAPDVKTATRTVKGKFSYLSPEILEGGDPSPSSDTYAAAVVLHEILVGRNEFRTSSATSTVGRVLTHVASRVDAVRGDCSAELADVLEIALEKDPRKRYESASDFAKALRGVRGMPGEEADALLAETFARDFRDPSLPKMFELPELEELERVMRAPGPATSSIPPALVPDPTSDEVHGSNDATRRMGRARNLEHAATISMEAPAFVDEMPARRRVPWGAAVAITGLLALVGGGIAWWAQRPAPPEVVYVEASPAGIAPAETEPPQAGVPDPPQLAEPPEPDPVLPAPVERDTTPATTTAPGSERRATSRRAGDEAAAIQRAFASHTADMRRCFASAPPDAPRELALHFSVDTTGRVQRVDLSPREAASTGPGECVLRSARAIRFPATAEPRSFRIPIEVRPR